MLNYIGCLAGPREATSGPVTVYEYERGLLYVRGKFVRVLEPGRYRIWPFTHRRVVVVDLPGHAPHRQPEAADGRPGHGDAQPRGRLRSSDPAAAVHKVADFRAQLYEDVQLAARNVVGAATVDGLLQDRTRINGEVLEAVRPLAEGYGCARARGGYQGRHPGPEGPRPSDEGGGGEASRAGHVDRRPRGGGHAARPGQRRPAGGRAPAAAASA